MPSINQIKYYCEVAKNLSFSGAASNLFITQPTLNRQMTELENELNMQLFIRSPKGLKLTPSGKILYDEFSKLLTMYRSAVDNAENAFNGYRNTVNVGLISGIFIDEIIADIIKSLSCSFPDIHLNVQRFPFKELMSRLYNDELDIVFTFNYVKKPANLYSSRFVSFIPSWFIPKRNPLSNNTSISFKDLTDQEILLIQNNNWQDGSENITKHFLKYGGFTPKYYYVNDMDNLLMKLETDNKCAFLNSRVKVSDNIAVFPVRELENEDFYLEYSWKKTNRKSGLTSFIQILNETHVTE